jgi:hypothetical protein
LNWFIPEGELADNYISFGSGVTKDGVSFCHLVWGNMKGQLTPDELRALGRRAFEVAEAAERDAMTFAWLSARLGYSLAAEALVDMRDYRFDSDTSKRKPE